MVKIVLMDEERGHQEKDHDAGGHDKCGSLGEVAPRFLSGLDGFGVDIYGGMVVAHGKYLFNYNAIEPDFRRAGKPRC